MIVCILSVHATLKTKTEKSFVRRLYFASAVFLVNLRLVAHKRIVLF
jgi:hypothetical protein